MPLFNKTHKLAGALLLLVLSLCFLLRSCGNGKERSEPPLRNEAEKTSVSLPPDAELKCPHCKKSARFSDYRPQGGAFLVCPGCGRKISRFQALKFMFRRETKKKAAAKHP